MIQKKQSKSKLVKEILRMKTNGCLSTGDVYFIVNLSVTTYGYENMPLGFLEMYASHLEQYTKDKGGREDE